MRIILKFFFFIALLVPVTISCQKVIYKIRAPYNIVDEGDGKKFNFDNLSIDITTLEPHH